MSRQPITIYVTPDERACIDRAAREAGSRSAYVRKVALYRAAWQGYSGPLFSAFDAGDELQQWQHADLLFEAARTLAEGADTLIALLERGESPHEALVSTVASFARVITRGKAHLCHERLGTDTTGLPLRLQLQAQALEKHHGFVAKQIAGAARALRRAMEEPNGTPATSKKTRNPK